MNTHLDQLAQWWDEAEEGVIEKGDTVINRSDGETTVYVATVRARRQHPSARILSRAPKPKPAWHDAVAVIATSTVGDQDGGGPVGRVFERVEHLGGREVVWAHGDIEYETGELCDVTPLIEAKVTDEMVDRILDVIDARFDNYPAGIGEALAVAALGIKAE